MNTFKRLLRKENLWMLVRIREISLVQFLEELKRLNAMIQCRNCTDWIDKEEFNASTDECNECHDDSGLNYNECGCDRCVDKISGMADDLYDAWRDGE